MKAIKNFEGFKKSLLTATNGTMVETFDASIMFDGLDYQSYRIYVDDVHYYNMFVIYYFVNNSYDVALETSCCGTSTMSRAVKTQKALIESVVAWISCNYLNAKKIDIDSEEYTDQCEETEKHYDDYTSEDFVNAGIAKECTDCPDLCEEDCIENAECAKGNDVFEGCKTVKDVMEVKQELNARFGKEQQYFDTDTVQPNETTIAKIEKMSLPCLTCKHFCAVFDNERIKMTHCVRKNTENYLKAVKNPNWHNVSLKTLANIDNDMLDEKRRLYMRVYRMTVNVVNSIYKCNRLSSIDKLRTNLIQTVRNMAKNGAIEWALVCYVKAKIDNCYLVKGLQSSFYSVTYNNKKSRSYTKTFYI